MKCALTSPFNRRSPCGLRTSCLSLLHRPTDRICGSSYLSSLIGQKDVVAFRTPTVSGDLKWGTGKATTNLRAVAVCNRISQTKRAMHDAYQANQIAPSSSLPSLFFWGAVQTDPTPRHSPLQIPRQRSRITIFSSLLLPVSNEINHSHGNSSRSALLFKLTCPSSADGESRRLSGHRSLFRIVGRKSPV